MIGSSASMILHGASEDRISHMPKDVIGMILNGMPLRDAVRTSVLSRKWKYHWVMTSELLFDYMFFKSLNIKYKTDLQVRHIINKILLLHTGPIHKFTLDIDLYISLNDDLDYWIPFLSRTHIKEFTLRYSCVDFYQLATELYSCLELTYLNIGRCKLNPPASFERFPNLMTLELYMVSVNGKFSDVISACPRLERVSIIDCNGIHTLVVQAPNLKYLSLRRVNGLKTVCLIGTKNLETYDIYLDNDEAPAAGVEKLCLGDDVLEYPASSSVPKRLTPVLVNLKTISLSCIDFNDVSQIARVLCLIRSSPKLSWLQIEGLRAEPALRQDVNFVEDCDDDFSFGQLKSVRLLLLWGSKAEMAVIKLLLARSPLLEDMYIRMHDKVGMAKSHSMCKELMRFGRASPKADLFYYDLL